MYITLFLRNIHGPKNNKCAVNFLDFDFDLKIRYMYNVSNNSSWPFVNIGCLQWPPFSEEIDIICIKCIFCSTFTSAWHKICLKDHKKVYY